MEFEDTLLRGMSRSEKDKHCNDSTSLRNETLEQCSVEAGGRWKWQLIIDGQEVLVKQDGQAPEICYKALHLKSRVMYCTRKHLLTRYSLKKKEEGTRAKCFDHNKLFFSIV